MSVTWEGATAQAWQDRLNVPAMHLYETVGSTNDVARTLAEQGAPSLTVVVADHQTSGRGRGGRTWLSAPGSSLLCSLVFQVADEQASAPGAVPVRVGHAVARALSAAADVAAHVKWPNDVVIPGHGKVAGILCEAVLRQGGGFVIVGIGINVRAPGGDFTALERISRHAPGRGRLLEEVVRELAPLADRIMAPLGDAERGDMRARDVLLDKLVEDGAGLTGVACGIASDGSLCVRTEAGIRTVHNASIRLAHNHEYPGANV